MWKSPPSEETFDRDDDTVTDLLTGTVKRVTTLSLQERERMFQLLVENFTNTTRQRFESDLAEKEWVVVLNGELSGIIQGFSTLMQLDAQLGDKPVTVFFSGDTIIHRKYWGQTVLPRLWSRHVFSLASAMADRTVYWYLICSGYKTYRFLPVFFKEFYPCYNRSTPVEIKQLMNILGESRYPQEYDSKEGIIRFAEASALKEGIADITARRLRDSHIAYFLQANPGHVRGDELVCITEISPANVTPAGKRMIGDEGYSE
jgi:hypothetical protein